MGDRSVAGAWINTRSEQGRWLRDQKLNAAAEMVSAGINIYEYRRGRAEWHEMFEPSELREWQSRLRQCRAVIHLLCTRETRDRADAFAQSCWRSGRSAEEHKEDVIATLGTFNTALRKEIGS